MSAAAPSSADGPMPCTDALWAGTLALMTVYAQAGNASGSQNSARLPVAQKIAANLALLADHPALSPALRRVVQKARETWADIVRGVTQGCALH